MQLMLSMRPHDASNSSDGPPVLKLTDHVNDPSAMHKHAQSKRTYNEGTEQDTSNCKQNVLKLVLKKIMIHVFESYTFF